MKVDMPAIRGSSEDSKSDENDKEKFGTLESMEYGNDDHQNGLVYEEPMTHMIHHLKEKLIGPSCNILWRNG